MSEALDCLNLMHYLVQYMLLLTLIGLTFVFVFFYQIN